MHNTVFPQESIFSPQFTPLRERLPNAPVIPVPPGLHVLEESGLDEAFALLLDALENTDGNALIIDALSVTNPHHIVQICKRQGRDYRTCLDRILIERPFTAYQMTSVVGELLPKWIKEDNIKVIMGIGLFTLLQDPDLGELYRQWGKGLIMRRLKVATQYYGLSTFLLPLQGKSHLYFLNTLRTGK